MLVRLTPETTISKPGRESQGKLVRVLVADHLDVTKELLCFYHREVYLLRAGRGLDRDAVPISVSCIIRLMMFALGKECALKKVRAYHGIAIDCNLKYGAIM